MIVSASSREAHLGLYNSAVVEDIMVDAMQYM